MIGVRVISGASVVVPPPACAEGTRDGARLCVATACAAVMGEETSHPAVQVRQAG